MSLARGCCMASSRSSQLNVPVFFDYEEVRCCPSSVLASSYPISLQDGHSEVALAATLGSVNGGNVGGARGEGEGRIAEYGESCESSPRSPSTSL